MAIRGFHKIMQMFIFAFLLLLLFVAGPVASACVERPLYSNFGEGFAAQDSFNLGLLKDRGDIIQTLKSEAAPDVVLVGDSLFALMEKNRGHYYVEGHSILNLAISGAKTQHVIWLMENLPVDIISPRFAVLLVGTNNLNARELPCDILGQTLRIVYAMRLKWPRAQHVVIGMLPRGRGGVFRHADRHRINRELHRKSNREGFIYVDPTLAFWCGGSNECGYFAADLLHLTSAGYEQLWSLLRATILSGSEAPKALLVNMP